MNALASAPLLRIPPFPNTTAMPLSKSGSDGRGQMTDYHLDEISAAMVEARVGGTYWAAQLPLPAAPYTLVRIADPDLRRRTVAALGDERRILEWTSSASPTTGEADPWHLLSGAADVLVDADDELALLAALAKVPLRCVGNGRFETLASGGAAAVRLALRKHAIENIRYINPFTGQNIDLMEAIALCAFWRALIDSNRDMGGALGFAFWKRPTIAPLLWGGTLPVSFSAKPTSFIADLPIAVWKSRADPAAIRELQGSKARLIEVEDGFIRSIGLGADCVPPLSIVVDRLGVYFDPNHPSDLEALLEHGQFGPEIVDRARRLRALIVETGISKYGIEVTKPERREIGKRCLLVPGQVEDDRSVVSGGGNVRTNLDLLRRVRGSNPEAHIIYKPHPDVEAGHRTGHIADEECLVLANEVARNASISSLIDLVDEVHVNTSLAGFEALLRGKPVTTHGVPFYAGWGLTSDLGAVPTRRTARRTIDELVAATLLRYPRYLDPVTGLPCPPEILIRRLSDGGVGRVNGIVVWLRRFQGRANRVMAKLTS